MDNLVEAAPTPDSASLLGVIICGGESRRMGRDKGLLPYNGAPRALHVAKKLNIPVVFSINAAQLPHYTAQLPGKQFVVDDPAITHGGPLKGLLSVHNKFPGKDLLLLACDMLDMDVDTIETLIEAWRSASADFYAYRENGFFQPLCAIYTRAGISGNARAESPQALLKEGRTKALPVIRPEAFKNYNTE